jgi:twitching motility protein PilT
MIGHINTTRRAHITTIEDPIEYLHKNNKSIINQRELGLDTTSYAEALKNVVRQDPNVILIGEMRDLETATTALTAAQTGHLVFSTIHTTNTVQIISRILDLFPPHQQAQVRLQLADTLRGALSQRLLRTVDGKGRIPAVEVMIVTPLVRRAIEDNSHADIDAAMRQGAYYGMQTFNQALIALYERGRVSFEEALAAASSPEEFMLAARGITASHEQSQQKRFG